MAAYADDFGPFDDHIWLNCAHQGPLPKRAVSEAHAALRQKVAPHRLPYSAFDDVPARLRTALASVVGCSADDVILGNSTSYGLNLLVQGLPLEEGDEVLLIDGDFPATVMTWLPLRKKGIFIRTYRPSQWPPSPTEIAEQFSERTRVFCTSWVFSFFGAALDIHGLGELCRAAGITFVVNGSQAIGTRDINVESAPIDALVSCGFKWLCGPYGTGFAYIRPELLERLRYEQAYWLAHASPRTPTYELRPGIEAARFDVFGTANFLNFGPWSASVEYLATAGIPNVERYNHALVQQVIDGLTGAGYELVSPIDGEARSTLVVFSHVDAERNRAIYEELEESGIHVAERDGKLRISPHLHNTSEEIEEAIALLAKLA